MDEWDEYVRIEPAQIRFLRRAGRLVALWNGREESVTAKRLFPMSHPDGPVRVANLQGAEWGTLPCTHGMEEGSKETLENELRLNPFLPRIEAIHAIRRRMQHFEWEVATDCGMARFETAPLYESISALPGGVRMVVDVHDQQYLLPAENDMEKMSRRRLAKWL